MNHERDLERLLDTWLTDGPLVVADRVVDDVAARIVRQPQRPAWRLQPWRFPAMSSSLKIVLIGAALLAALGASSVLFGGAGRGPAPGPSPSPSPTPTPTLSPSPSAVYPSWFPPQGNGAGILAKGTQATRQFLGGSTFTVPEGWVNEGDDALVYTLFPNTPANQAEYALSKQTAQNIVLTNKVVNNMFAICDATGLFQGATASEVVAAVLANPAFKSSATKAVDVTIAGLSGQQVDLRLSPAWTGKCTLNPDDPPTRDYKDARMRLIVLDTPGGGTIGIAVSSLYSSGFQTLLGDAMPIVESFQFAVGSKASPSP